MAANTNAFVKTIGSKESGLGEDSSVNQKSPSWILTFVRWEIRDTFRTSDQGNVTSTSVRDPLVVQNDCLQLSVTVNKGTLTPNMSATLVQTNVNYETALAPGDFVFVNILDWDKEADRVALQAKALKPINGQNDGFKGIFKIQSVRKIIQTDPNSGTKILLFKISGFAFTEFNNTIYFNPFLIDNSQKASALFINNTGNDWALRVNKKGLTDPRDILKSLIDSFIGTGIPDNPKAQSAAISNNFNTHFVIPQKVGSLLGVSGAIAAKDIYNYIFGVQSYSSGQVQSLSSGMNPSGLTNVGGRYWYTPVTCQGKVLLKAEYWNQVKMWSILNQYTNSPLNELFTCFRISPNGNVMPTVVFRQIPFTNDDFSASNVPVTKFMNIPRWKISPSLVYNLDVGRDEAARINFMQYFGRSTINQNGWEISAEIAQGNYAFDQNDVLRSGLRPYIVTTQFDEIAGDKTQYSSPDWAKIVGDSVIGGHLKMNGSIETVGIVEPIAVGDNLDFDGVVYHIEQITHSCFVSPGTDGKALKNFRTVISLSSGLSKQSGSTGVAYSEMLFPNAQKFRENDYNSNKLLPGISESQSTIYRTGNPEIEDSPQGNAGFVQPQNSTPTPNDDVEE